MNPIPSQPDSLDLFPMAKGTTTSPESLVLTISGRGPVPGFKNSKMILGIRPVPNQPKLWRGTPFVGTRFDMKKVMDQITEDFLSQLNSAFQTYATGTQTTPCPRSWIASWLPERDSWTHIPDQSVRCRLCAKGEEGATITITRL